MQNIVYHSQTYVSWSPYHFVQGADYQDTISVDNNELYIYIMYIK